MSSITIHNPENMAKMLLDTYWNNSLPINPIFFAQKAGINVYSYDGNDRSGYYDHEKKIIYVNTKEPSQRQRFTIAHELGHALLHNETLSRDNYKNDWGTYQIKEMEANRFAAELLMPRGAVKAVVDTAPPFPELCRIFDVSGEAMDIRLKNLGYYA